MIIRLNSLRGDEESKPSSLLLTNFNFNFMTYRTSEPLRICANALAADGIGTPISVADYRHISLQFGTTGNASFVVKFQGSTSTDAPTFSSAQSVTNHWDYIEVVDLEDGAVIAGDDGITMAGTDEFRNLIPNQDHLKWVNVIMSSRQAGTLTVKVAPSMN